MSYDFNDFSEWIPSDEELRELEDRDFEFYTQEVEAPSVGEYEGPCDSCTNCAVGSHPVGGEFENRETSLDIVEVEFRFNRNGFFVNESGISFMTGSYVIVESQFGLDMGKVISVGEEVKQKRRSRGIIGQPMRKILRTANVEDINEALSNRYAEDDAASTFRNLCKKLLLEMKLIAVEYQFDRSRITFYYTADGRVDFRNLIHDLSHIFRTRIEMRQLGARDEAKMNGGIGICGREICCITWINQLKRVTSNHARIQGVTLNPRRLGGLCGKVKCCMSFEVQNYADEHQYDEEYQL